METVDPVDAAGEGVHGGTQENAIGGAGPLAALRRALQDRGLRHQTAYRLPHDVPRIADLAFPELKVAVFLDRCFWRECPEPHLDERTDAGHWSEEAGRERRRNALSDRRLFADGWAVVHVWEHQDPRRAAEQIAEVVRDRALMRRERGAR